MPSSPKLCSAQHGRMLSDGAEYSVRYTMPSGHDAAPPSVYPAPEHVCRQQSDSVQAPLMRASLDEHSCHSPRNVAPAAHMDSSAKADRPHLGTQHSDRSAHLSPQP